MKPLPVVRRPLMRLIHLLTRLGLSIQLHFIELHIQMLNTQLSTLPSTRRTWSGHLRDELHTARIKEHCVAMRLAGLRDIRDMRGAA